MRPTTRCVACQNHISVGEPTCWACGVAQAPSTPSAPAPVQTQVEDPYHRLCPRCRYAVAVYHRECRNCGHVLGRSTNTLPAELPPGWEAVPQPDGAFLISHTAWKGVRCGGASPGFLFVVMFWLLLEIFRGLLSHRGPELDPATHVATLVLMLVLALLVTIGLIWLLFGRERWRVGPNLIQIEKECLGRRWGHSHTLAELMLRTQWHSSRYRRYRVCQLVVRECGKDYVLSEAGLNRALEVQALGSYLSAHTGWPLQLPLEWPPTPALWELF